MAIDAFIASEETEARVLDAFKDRNIAKMQGNVAMGVLSAAVDHYSEVPTPNVLIIEFDVPSEEMMEGLEQLAEICDPGTQVVIIGIENDVQLYRKLVKLGISDYLPGPTAVRLTERCWL